MHIKKGIESILRGNGKLKKAFMLQGEELEKGMIGINHFNIKLDEFKKCSKENDASISIYLIAMVAYSIYETNYKINNGKKPINICVPVNFKKYINSETLSNFFSYLVVNLNLKKDIKYSFEDILFMVKKEFEKKLKLEKILGTITKDAGSTNNIFVRIVPLVIKKMVASVASLEVKRHFTMTFSNIGKVDVEDKYSKYIKKFLVILSPDWAEKTKCGICSYDNNLVVTFGTILKENLMQEKFKKLLKERNITFNIEGNGVINVSN